MEGFKIDKSMLTTLVVFVLVVIAGMFLYRKFVAPAPPANSITLAQYNALDATAKAGYIIDPNGSGYYVPKTA